MRSKNIQVLSFSMLGLAAVGIYLVIRNKKRLPKMETASYVDLSKYLGTWYDIAHLPASFQKSCYNTKAEYSQVVNGKINIKNSCNLGSIHGEYDEVEGIATVVDTNTNAKLKVEFLWPFKGDYWILHVDNNYQYALVGEPSRKYLWMLSRNTNLPDDILESLIEIANEKGFSTNNLVMSRHMLHD